ncbi:MAG: aspartate dehydrogenase [Parasporobacterium sp.]|nr:aspartate dehydrogenase [Parasporobacterium sp.]
MLFKKKKTEPVTTYDLAHFTPVLRCSICTGEQTAGFRDNASGIFHEIMRIRNDKDLQEFKDTYKVSELKKEY